MDEADSVWRSMNAGVAVGAQVAAVDVAAVNGGGPQGRRNQQQRGGRRGGRRGAHQGGAQGQGQGPQEVLPEGCCSLHARFGKKAYYCKDEEKCPWRMFKNPPKDNKSDK